MQKRIWITSLSKDKNLTAGLLQLGKKYGLAPDGHFWVDENHRMAWQAPLENLVSKDTALWVIAAAKKDLEKESVRYGLSLLCIRLQHARGIGFPILLTSPDDLPGAEDLPSPFKGCDILKTDNKSLGAKMTALANTPIKKIPTDYRIDIHAHPGYGTWFELGPSAGITWNGVLAGGLKSEIDAHGVGIKGELPLRTVLEYPMRGLRLSKGKDEYTAWAVKNILHEDQSYYVRFKEAPGNILFGPMPDEADEMDLHCLNLS